MKSRRIKNTARLPFSTILTDREDGKFYEVNVDTVAQRIKLVEVSELDLFDSQRQFYGPNSGPYIWIESGLSIRVLVRDGRIGYEVSENGSSQQIVTNDKAQAKTTRLITPTGFSPSGALAYIIGVASMTEILMAKSTDVESQISVPVHYRPEASQKIFDGYPIKSNINVTKITVIATGGAPAVSALNGTLQVDGIDVSGAFALNAGETYQTTILSPAVEVNAGSILGARWDASIPTDPGRPGIIVIDRELR